MPIQIRRRNLSPNTRKPDSAYKVDTENVNSNDVLRIEIYERAKGDDPLFVYEIAGREVAAKNSISFHANRFGGKWEIRWSGAAPRLVDSGRVAMPNRTEEELPVLSSATGRIEMHAPASMETAQILQRIRISKQRFAIVRLPHDPGVYGIFLAPGITIAPGLVRPGDLLYIGKAEDSLYSRLLGTHFSTGKTGQSTLRRSLGAILKEALGLNALPRSSKCTKQDINCYVFAHEGDGHLTEWMLAHLEIGYCAIPEPWKPIRLIEHELLIASNPHPVLDLDPRTRYLNPNCDRLASLREICRREAKASASG